MSVAPVSRKQHAVLYSRLWLRSVLSTCVSKQPRSLWESAEMTGAVLQAAGRPYRGHDRNRLVAIDRYASTPADDSAAVLTRAALV